MYIVTYTHENYDYELTSEKRIAGLFESHSQIGFALSEAHRLKDDKFDSFWIKAHGQDEAIGTLRIIDHKGFPRVHKFRIKRYRIGKVSSMPTDSHRWDIDRDSTTRLDIPIEKFRIMQDRYADDGDFILDTLKMLTDADPTKLEQALRGTLNTSGNSSYTWIIH